LQPLSDSQMEALEEATRTYQAARTSEAGLYLMDRGLEPETVDTFRLGSVVDPLPGHNRYKGWLAIPYLDKDGEQPLTIRFRCIDKHNHRENGHGKYESLSGDTSRVYNVGAIARASDTLHVTEGEFDAMILEQCGLPAIALPGAAMFRSHHRRLLAGFSRVWVWSDPDEAGADLLNRITASLRQAKGVRLQVGDVTETYLAGGEDAIHELIKTKKEAA
jgi:DNA primase